MKNKTIYEIIKNHPETIEFFESKGFKNLHDEKSLLIYKNITLKTALMMKKLNIDAFIEILNEIINSNQNIDITLKNNNQKKENSIEMLGLLPCPIRIPLLEALENFLKENNNIKVNYDLKAAAYGLDWLKEDVIKANKPEKLADIFISAGFDLFFENELMGKFKNENVFHDFTGVENYNKDFNNDKISLKDPDSDYSMLGVVPAVFLVNTEELKGRKVPKTWEDVLSPEFENSVSLPISDFDLFNSILISLYKLYGKEAIKKLRKSLLQNLHPSQMVKSDKFKEDIPAITIMPYFFTKMITKNSPMKAIWPEDGAIISPIFMLTKKTNDKSTLQLIKFLAGEKVGKIFSHTGLFPTVNPNINNNLEGKNFLWVGWDYIHKNDISKILKECKNLFEEEK